jgi:tRNA dimethylallyltransferase
MDMMMEEGLEEEVRRLVELGVKRDSVAMQGLGYKQMLAYLDGETSLTEAVALIKRDTRRYAKRQLTWLRRERDTIWLNKGDFADDNAICDEMVRVLQKKKILQ